MKYILYHLYRFTYVIQRWRAKRFTPFGRALLIVLLFAAIFGLDTKQTMAYQAFALLFMVFLVEMIASLFFRCRLSATRILPRYGSVGNPLDYRLVVDNPTDRIQRGLVLIENFEFAWPSYRDYIESTEPGENQRNPVDRVLGYYRWLWLIAIKRRASAEAVHLPPLQPNSKTRIAATIVPLHRGVLRFRGFTIARSGPLGLFNAVRVFSLPESIIILPKRYDLPPIVLAGSRRYQSGGVALASSVGDSEEFIALRDYRPGDPLRKIHWKSWAKVGKPVVKEYQDEFFVRHALILDTFLDGGDHRILEEAVSIAASLACQIQTRESLLDLMFVGTQAYCFTSGRGLAGTDKLLEILAGIDACRDKPFENLTPIVVNRAPQLSSCICVLLAWDEARKRLIEHLRALDIHTLVLVITEGQDNRNLIDPGPLTDKPHHFHRLQVRDIQAGLMKI